MEDEGSEFAEFLREVAAETRSESLGEAAGRLGARRQVARELESLARQDVSVLEEVSIGATPGAVSARVAFDFTVVSRDVEVGIVLVSDTSGERMLSRALLESCRDASLAVTSLVAVVFVWMGEKLPAKGMDCGELEKRLAEGTAATVSVGDERMRPVREVVERVLADHIRELPVPSGLGEEEEGAVARDGDVLSVFSEAVRRELSAIAKKRYQLEERKEAAKHLSEGDAQALVELFEALMSSEEVGDEQVGQVVEELVSRLMGKGESGEGVA